MDSRIIMAIGTWVAIFAVFYFALIRPQKKKDKKLNDMRESLGVGDTVVTIGGIVGEVAKVEEDTVVLAVGPNKNRIPFKKWAIGTVESSKAPKIKETKEVKETKEEKTDK